MVQQSNELLDKVTELFWAKGFQATSMRDVQHALNMRPGSLYARFPGKSALFVQVMKHYAGQLKAHLLTIAQASDLIEATRMFFTQELLRAPDKRYQRQCLLINAMAERSKLDDNAAVALDAALNDVEDGFRHLISALQHHHFVTQTVPVKIVAKWLQTQFIALRHTAYRSADDAGVAYHIDKLLLDLQGQWPTSHGSSSSPAELPD